MSSSPKKFRVFRSVRERGMIAQVLTLIGIVGGIAGTLATLSGTFSKAGRRRVITSRATVENSSAVETVLLSMRAAESAYIRALPAGCDTAVPFYEALKGGSGCAGNIVVFRGDQLNPKEPGITEGVYVYNESCTISQAASDCRGKEILRFNVGGGPLPGRELAAVDDKLPVIRITLTNPMPERNITEFVGNRNENGKAVGKFGFAIRGTLPNAAHMEADGRVTQERPDPASFCPGDVWATFPVFVGSTCVNFVQLGGGTGLAYYRDRYFGFRPADGMVIDMIQATGAASYIVGENGCLTSGGCSTPAEKIFPPHNRDALLNVDDITVIGQTIYYVANSGASAYIGALDPANPGGPAIRLCELGSMGWGQSYEGIAALGTSVPLLPQPGETIRPPDRIATFYLKTSSGNFLTAIVTTDADGNPHGPGATPNCFVMKDKRIQEVEYMRTYGFDRVAGAKPYILY